MSSKCELSGTRVLYGNKVSHSQRKTRRRFEPNIRVVRFISNLMGERYKFKVRAQAIRCVEKMGGFDEYMLRATENELSAKAKVIRRKILEKKMELAK